MRVPDFHYFSNELAYSYIIKGINTTHLSCVGFGQRRAAEKVVWRRNKESHVRLSGARTTPHSWSCLYGISNDAAANRVLLSVVSMRDIHELFGVATKNEDDMNWHSPSFRRSYT